MGSRPLASVLRLLAATSLCFGLAGAAAGQRPSNSAVRSSAAPAALPSLESYVGKYGFDKVNGVKFVQHPKVSAGVTRAVPDAEARRWILAGDGPQSAIERQGRWIVWGSGQDHNSANHNWTVYVSPDGRDLKVCYFDAPESGPGATPAGYTDRFFSSWYAKGQVRRQRGSCIKDDATGLDRLFESSASSPVVR